MNRETTEDITEIVRTPGGALDDRLLEEEYLQAEKGKMNTLSVSQMVVILAVVLYQPHERYCRYRIACCPLCFFKSVF